MREDKPGAQGDPSTSSGSPHRQQCRPTAPEEGSARDITALADCPVTRQGDNSGLASVQEDKSETAGDKAGHKATAEVEAPAMKPSQQEARLEMVWPQHGSGKEWG